MAIAEIERNPDVLVNRQLVEHARNLELPADPQLADGIHRLAGNVLAVVKDLAFTGLVETGNEVEESGLAASIGAYDAA
jgi:hypothetical protein